MMEESSHLGVEDVARFGPAEDGAVVRASLACPYCLHQPAHVMIATHTTTGEAICICSRCRSQWSVLLDAGQSLRLCLAPPRGLWVQVHQFGRGRSE
jgi:hypothetical protein